MRIKKIGLITKTYLTDEIGQKRPAETVRTVFAEIFSISANEFAIAGQLGLKPDVRIKIWESEYKNEEDILIDFERYKVYRTYFDKSGKAELYLEKSKK